MIDSISAIGKNEVLASLPDLFSPVQTTVTRLFSQAQEAAKETQLALHPLLANPAEIALGGMWSFFLAVGAFCAVDSFYELYKTCTVEHPASERFEKMGSAVKKVFTNAIGFGGTCAYTVHWAHEAHLLSLGSYALLFRCLGLGGSLIINGVESGAAIYHIHREKEAILAEQSPVEREKHKQRLCLSLMNLIGNVAMVAWTVLGIVAVVYGTVFSPILMVSLLGISCIFSLAAYAYKWKLENRPECFLRSQTHTPIGA